MASQSSHQNLTLMSSRLVMRSPMEIVAAMKVVMRRIQIAVALCSMMPTVV